MSMTFRVPSILRYPPEIKLVILQQYTKLIVRSQRTKGYSGTIIKDQHVGRTTKHSRTDSLGRFLPVHNSSLLEGAPF